MLQFSQMFTKAKNITSEKFILITEVNLGKNFLFTFDGKIHFDHSRIPTFPD